MPRNIEKIRLWERNPGQKNDIPVVRIDFAFPCTWTIFEIEDLLQIIRLWIKGEEERYPPNKGFKGRWLLYEKIKEVFENE